MEFMQSFLVVIIGVLSCIVFKQGREINGLKENAKDDGLLIALLTDIIRNEEPE